MKKFGTPIRAGPGVESEKVGFVGAGEPSWLVSAGAGAGVVAGVLFPVVWCLSRPEVESECLTLPVPPDCPLPVRRLVDFLRGELAGMGVAVALEPGVAV